MKNVLVYIDEEAVEDSIDLLEIGRQMYGATGFQSSALAAAGHYGVAGSVFDHVFVPLQGTVPNYNAAGIARCIETLHREHQFDAILIPATHWGRVIAPRAAMRLGAGLVADVTGISNDGHENLLVRPAFSGRMLASVVCREGGPVMMSVRPRTFFFRERVLGTAVVHKFDSGDRATEGIRLIERRVRNEARDIRESDVLIAGGGGATRDFPLLEKLATELHGMVAASRKAVDQGKAPRTIQVGQSGKIVSPRLYIALGISGSSQHVAGIRNSEHVISVNTSIQAPICSMSDIVVEGDSRAFVEALLNKIQATRTKTQGGTK